MHALSELEEKEGGSFWESAVVDDEEEEDEDEYEDACELGQGMQLLGDDEDEDEDEDEVGAEGAYEVGCFV
jgi:hypothetical protein